jgi:hypothetical protein
MMFRAALWPSDGDSDAIIHSAVQGGPDGCCGLMHFSNGTSDRQIIEMWNRRPRPAGDAREAFDDEESAWLIERIEGDLRLILSALKERGEALETALGYMATAAMDIHTTTKAHAARTLEEGIR